VAILKNRTQSSFTMISNSILRDKELSMKDRGVLCTLISLPDGWKFSEAGLVSLVPDGREVIKSSIRRLERLGYVIRRMERDKTGKYISEIEVFTERESMTGFPLRFIRNGKSVNGSSATENQSQYNTDNKKRKCIKDYSKSIYQSDEKETCNRKMEEIEAYKQIIAENIKLSWLLDIAAKHSSDEVAMVEEMYQVICDVVCHVRESIRVKGVSYSGEEVKSRFLKLRYEHVAEILNRIVDSNLKIRNMYDYLVSTLFVASTVGTLEIQAKLHDDYLKFLRGNPYE